MQHISNSNDTHTHTTILHVRAFFSRVLCLLPSHSLLNEDTHKHALFLFASEYDSRRACARASGAFLNSLCLLVSLNSSRIGIIPAYLLSAFFPSLLSAYQFNSNGINTGVAPSVKGTHTHTGCSQRNQYDFFRRGTKKTTTQKH